MLGVLYTWTTYGTWLRGDTRGWVDAGTTYPADPDLEAADRDRLKHSPWLFDPADRLRIGQMIGDSLRQRTDVSLYALTVQTWHVHLVAAGSTPEDAVVKCGKDAVRWGLRPNRPVWTEGFDKRFCFDEESLRNRIEYVERHNIEAGWPAKPWAFLFDPPWADMLVRRFSPP